MKEMVICALLIGEAETQSKVNQIAKSYENCPYVYFMSTKGKNLYAIYFLPTRQKWWIEYIEKDPQHTLQLEKVQVIFSDIIQYPKELSLRIPKEVKKTSPCGDNCGTCSSLTKCTCCPATVYYKL